jgi:hypothetical protein
MGSSGMICHVALVRTDVSEELSPSIIRVMRNGELGTTLAVTSNRHTLRRHTMWNKMHVWDTRVRVGKGKCGGKACSGLDFEGMLNGQTTK